MSKNTSFVIGDHFATFVDAQVADGRYSSTSDVVRAGLRLLEDQETKLAALRAALIEAENGSASTLFDSTTSDLATVASTLVEPAASASLPCTLSSSGFVFSGSILLPSSRSPPSWDSGDSTKLRPNVTVGQQSSATPDLSQSTGLRQMPVFLGFFDKSDRKLAQRIFQ